MLALRYVLILDRQNVSKWPNMDLEEWGEMNDQFKV